MHPNSHTSHRGRGCRHVSSARLILEGRQPSLLGMYYRATHYFLEEDSSFLPTTLKMRFQSHRSLPSIAANPVWYLDFCGHLRKLDTTMFCDPLTSAPASPSPFSFTFFLCISNGPTKIVISGPICSLLIFIIYPHCIIIIFRILIIIVFIIFFLFVVFHHNPFFSVLVQQL